MPRPTENNSPYHEISSCLSPIFAIPPHIMGRNVQNPTSDTTSPGRRLQKPRPGVRIPYRNLTSQIVTQDEIAQEILQRSMKKNSGSQPASHVTDNIKTEVVHVGASGDSVFAMRLSRRLANRLSSSQNELEPDRNHGDLWNKVEAEPSGMTNLLINFEASSAVDHQLEKEVHGDSNGNMSAALSHCTSFSPRLNRHHTKLDRNAEREMALKQLSELPMIKGGPRELAAAVISENCNKRALCNSDNLVKLNLIPLNTSDLKQIEKRGVFRCPDSGSNVCGSQIVLDEPSVHLHKHNLENFPSSTQSQGNLVSDPIKSNLIFQSTKVKCAGKKNVGRVAEKKPQCKHRANTKESKLRINKTLKSGVPNGHCSPTKKEIRKRRSTRINVAHSKIGSTSSQVISKDKVISSEVIAKRVSRTRKQKNNSFLCTENPDIPAALESTHNGLSDRELTLCQNESDLHPTSSPNICSSQTLLESKIDQSRALNSASDLTAVFSSNKVKENIVCENYSDLLNTSSIEVSKPASVKSLNKNNKESLCSSSKERKKPTYVKGMTELEKLFADEGACNLLLEARALNKEIVKPKKAKLSHKKDLKKIAKQNIHYKASLFRKCVLLDNSASRPKRKITKEKLKEQVEMIDFTDTFSKGLSSGSPETSPPKILVPVAAKSPRVFRKHSSNNNFSVRNGCPGKINNDQNTKSSCYNRNSVQKRSTFLFEIDNGKVPVVDLERLHVSQMKSSLCLNKQHSLNRFSSSRKPVTVPRMSNAVRMKLNSEMSKNFQRGLDIESAKYISPKILKGKKNQVHCESLKVTPVGDEVKPSPVICEKVQSATTKQPGDDCVSSKSVKSLELLNGQELAVCVKKLQERNEVSITTINDNGERIDGLTKGHISPGTLPTTSVVPEQTTPLTEGADLVSKVKKCKDSNILSFEHLLDKEHRIVSVPLSPIAASYNSIMKNLKNATQKHKKKSASKLEKQIEMKECFRQRFSGRQNAGTYNYKEICLRRYENFVQIILAPGSTVMKNSLNVQVLHEFRDALQQLRRDRFCRVVLVTSTGSTFCQGVDLHSLIHINIEHRKKAAEELSQALKDFLKVLAMFNKPIVAGVHGATVGLGVTMLPFFDVVYASDKATFHAPYARLGQVPEGAAVLTLPLLLGNAVTSELLFGSRRLTASEALHYGLVTRVLWPDRFQEELIPNVKAIASQSSQSMESMKALLRLNLRVKLDATLDSESSLLVQHWCSPECQRNFRKFLETSDDVSLQRQKKDPS